MSCSPTDFLNLAKLSVEREHESDWRNAASRAYYSMYHQASALAEVSLPALNGDMGSHEKLSRRYKLAGGACITLGYTLETYKRIRHMADYHIGEDFAKSLAIEQIAAADLFIANLRSEAAARGIL